MGTLRNTRLVGIKCTKRNNMRNYIHTVLACLAAFMLGAYTDATIHGLKQIPLHIWIIDSLIMVIFIIMSQYKNKNKEI
jgi:hypothetical protein